MNRSSKSANEGKFKSFWWSAPIFRTRSPIARQIKMDSSLRMYNLATNVIAVCDRHLFVVIIVTISIIIIIIIMIVFNITSITFNVLQIKLSSVEVNPNATYAIKKWNEVCHPSGLRSNGTMMFMSTKLSWILDVPPKVFQTGSEPQDAACPPCSSPPLFASLLSTAVLKSSWPQNFLRS